MHVVSHGAADTSTHFHVIEDDLSSSDLAAQVSDNSSPVPMKAVYLATSLPLRSRGHRL